MTDKIGIAIIALVSILITNQFLLFIVKPENTWTLRKHKTRPRWRGFLTSPH